MRRSGRETEDRRRQACDRAGDQHAGYKDSGGDEHRTDQVLVVFHGDDTPLNMV